MKITLPALLLLAGSTAAQLQSKQISADTSPPPPHPLAYFESSNGLGLGLDGGRTELEMVDVDGDGHVDLVSVGDHGSPFINTQQHGVMVWFGSGLGQWTLQQEGDFGYGGVAVGDVNGDGFQDVGYGVHHDYSATDLGDQLLEVALGDGSGISWQAWDDGLATDDAWLRLTLTTPSGQSQATSRGAFRIIP